MGEGEGWIRGHSLVYGFHLHGRVCTYDHPCDCLLRMERRREGKASWRFYSRHS